MTAFYFYLRLDNFLIAKILYEFVPRLVLFDILASLRTMTASPCSGVTSKNVSTDDNGLRSSSGKVSSGSVSVPPSPRSEGEILQSPNLKSFSFSDLKMATRNFRNKQITITYGLL